MRKIVKLIKVRRPRMIISQSYPDGDLYLTWSSAHKVFNYVVFIYLPFDFSDVIDYILLKIFRN